MLPWWRLAILLVLAATAAEREGGDEGDSFGRKEGARVALVESRPPCCDFTAAAAKTRLARDFRQFYLGLFSRPMVKMLGNQLGMYWNFRGLAAARGEAFRVREDRSVAEDHEPPVAMIEMLPAHARPPGPSRGAAAEQRALRCLSEGHRPHDCEGSWTTILPMLQRETQAAMARFFAWPGAPAKPPAAVAAPDDAVVHLRCGDVVSTHNPEYGLLPFSYYRRVIPRGTRRVLVVGNFRAAQSGRGKFPKEIASEPLCGRILAAFTAYLARHRKDIASVQEVSAGFNRDFKLLTTARVMIASVSTYSFWAAMVNSVANGTMILPRCHLLMGCRTPALRYSVAEVAAMPRIQWVREPGLLFSRVLRNYDDEKVLAALRGELPPSDQIDPALSDASTCQEYDWQQRERDPTSPRALVPSPSPPPLPPTSSTAAVPLPLPPTAHRVPCCDFRVAASAQNAEFRDFSLGMFSRPRCKFIGNQLGVYFHWRGLASVRGEAFHIAKDPLAPFFAAVPPVSFLEFLPTDVEAPLRGASSGSFATARSSGDGGGGGGGGGEAAEQRAARCNSPSVSPHQCTDSWATIMPAVRRDTRRALDLFEQEARPRESVQATPTDAVVHLRCGDAVNTGNKEYGLLPFEYYRRVIPRGTRRVLVVGNFRAAQSGQGNFEAERRGMPLCMRILAAFTAYLARHRKDIASVQEVSAGFNHDFKLLATARVMIASVSTYSFWAAMVNSVAGGTLILPRCHLLMACRTPELRFTRTEVADLPRILWEAEPRMLPSVLLRRIGDDAILAALAGELQLPGEKGRAFNRTLRAINCD